MTNTTDWLESLNSPEQILANKKEGIIYVANFREKTGKYVSAAFDSDEEPYDVSLQISPRIEVRITYITANDSIRGVQISKLSGGKIENLTFSSLDFEGILNILKIFSGIDLSAVGNKSLVFDESIVQDPGLLKKTLLTILSDPTGQNVLKEVADACGIITDGDVTDIAAKRASLYLFERLLYDPEFFQAQKEEWQKTKDEDVWQHFFEGNTWIFGYGLEYVFNRPIDRGKFQQILAGNSVLNPGKRPDGLAKTMGSINFLNIVEIKKPDTQLLKEVQYRTSRVWSMSDELNGAISQCHQYIRISREEWGESQLMTDSAGDRTGEEIFNFHPKCFLLVGSLESEFLDEDGNIANPDKLSCFEDIRANISEPRIITYDELFHRAQNIVSSYSD